MRNFVLRPIIFIIFVTITLFGEPTIKLIKPNGGEKFISGQTMTVNWESKGSSDLHKNIIIILYKDGIKFRTISKSTPNSGTFNWRIPKNTPVNRKYRIRIRSKSNLSLNDFSDGDFSILSN